MHKKIYILIAVLFISSNSAFAETKGRNINYVTILISSYDKFSGIWPPFFDLLFKNWPSLKTYNKDVPIILVSNTKEFDNTRVVTIKSPAELGWNGNIRESLKHVNTKYVLYLQDDYFIRHPVLEDKIIEIINAADKNDLDYVEISPRCAQGEKKVDGLNFLKYKEAGSPCTTTLQAALWKRTALQEMTWDNQATAIWALEGRPLENHRNFAYYTPRIKPIDYHNFMYRGHINFFPYCWWSYKGYDAKFLDNYKIHPKYKFLSKESEWYRRNMPRLSKIAFSAIGFIKDMSYSIKRSFQKMLDRLN